MAGYKKKGPSAKPKKNRKGMRASLSADMIGRGKGSKIRRHIVPIVPL